MTLPCARALDPALRRPSRHRRQGPQAGARTGAPRRDHPEHGRGLVERHARRLHLADRPRRQRAGMNTLVVQYPQVPKPMAAGSASDLAQPRALKTVAAPLAAPAPQSEVRERADEQQASVEASGFQVLQDSPDASASALPRAPRACASRRPRSRPTCWCGPRRCWIPRRSSRRASSRPRTRRCCPAGSRSTVTAPSSDVAACGGRQGRNRASRLRRG